MFSLQLDTDLWASLWHHHSTTKISAMWIYQQTLAHNLNHSHSMLIIKDLEAQGVQFSSL